MLKRTFACRFHFSFCLVAIALLGLALGVPTRAIAQETTAQGNYQAERERAIKLTEESKFTEALPLLEKLAAANPSDPEVMFRLGFSRLAASRAITDPAARKQARANARAAFLRAKELGYDSPLLRSIMEALPPDDVEFVFSKNKEADQAMRDGEAAFVQGNLDKALAAYQRALQLDPQLYEAALFAGDMLNKNGHPESSGEWFARAIAIEPDRETAYRYWGLGLFKQNKMNEARDKFVEAYITEPYNRLAANGLIEWADYAKITPAHPKIDIPTTVSSPKPGEVNITVESPGKEDNGSAAWMMYGIARSSWMNGKDGKLSEKFAKQYPEEKTYRHSLAEESDALRLVALSLKEQMKSKTIKSLDPSLSNLLKLSDAGLLEAYILLARPDQGIAQDFVAYRKANRDKLRRYVVEHILSGGGQ
jgi:tetratricopeptide (TPR) repeat protein